MPAAEAERAGLPAQAVIPAAAERVEPVAGVGQAVPVAAAAVEVQAVRAAAVGVETDRDWRRFTGKK